MEIVVSITLGLWVSVSGWFCYKHYKIDEKREKEN